MKKFPNQEIINALKAKYKIPNVGIWDEGEGTQGYYYDKGDDHAEWDENGTLVYSDFDEFFDIES